MQIQKQVFEFARQWMQSYEQGHIVSDCMWHAMQATGVTLCTDAHREVARRAIAIVVNSGLSIN